MIKEMLLRLISTCFTKEDDTTGSDYPIDSDGNFLWMKKKSEDVVVDLARIHSNKYQNSAEGCTLR